jgi:hypothetical protein
MAYIANRLKHPVEMQFFKSKNIKYLMTNIVENEYYKKKHFSGYQQYVDQIDKEKFVGFGQAGMIEWVNKCPKGPGGHFLDQGHQQVADKLYEHIRNLGWLS